MNKKERQALAQARANEKARHPCVDCGKFISRYGIRCHTCHTRYMWQTGQLKAEHLPKGEKHHHWKGGRYKDFSGYIRVYNPEHHRACKNGYVCEHILVWEEVHGRPLPEGWIIHHLNGIRDDNRPKNLEGLSNKKHYLMLQAKAKRIQELEALLNNQHQLL